MRGAQLPLFKQEMKISIIGTNGFLSKAIAKYCNGKKYELDLYGLDEPQGHQFDNFYKVNLIKEDLNYDKILSSDIIIIAFGAGIQNNLHDSAQLIYELNVNVPIKICNNLRSRNFQGILISFGSYFEAGDLWADTKITEEELIKSGSEVPNDYSVSKRMLTKFVQSYSKEFTHWHFILPTIYGPDENSMRLIPYTIKGIQAGEDLNFTSGDQIRQYIPVTEIPKIIDLAYHMGMPSGIYNVEGNEIMSVKEIVFTIFKIFGKNMPSNCFGSNSRADASMKYLALDGSKLFNAIGYKDASRLMDNLMQYVGFSRMFNSLSNA